MSTEQSEWRHLEVLHKARSSVPQKTGKLSQKATLFAAFVSLQGKTMFIWQIKVAKTAKAKLCAIFSHTRP